jgi:hypothetical protein
MVSSGVTLITPTGGRPKAFQLCRQFVERQTYRGDLQWIIVDDGSMNSTIGTPKTFTSDFLWHGWSELSIYPQPRWQPGQNTQARNLLEAIPEVKFDKVLFFEDDDAYTSDYVEMMAALLDQHAIVGEIHAHYYHVPIKRWRVLQNEQHASLCQTGIRASLLPKLKTICEQPGPEFIDIQLWGGATGRRLVQSHNCIGMKGLPGREGIGIGHRPDNSFGWNVDSDLSVLRSWIGSDVELYREFM